MRRYYEKNLRTIVIYVRYILYNKMENYTMLPRKRPWHTRVHHTLFTTHIRGIYSKYDIMNCMPGSSVLT